MTSHCRGYIFSLMRICCRCRGEVDEDAPKSRKYCKPCWAEYAREYRAKHPDKHRAAVAKWREAHPDEHRASVKAWSAAHPEKKREYQQRWYKEHGLDRERQYQAENRDRLNEYQRKRHDSDEHRAWKREWHAKNAATVNAKTREKRGKDPGPFRAADRARYERCRYQRVMLAERARARRSGATGSHTVAEWKSVLRHFKRLCVYCGVKLTTKNISKDHDVPLKRLGSNSIRNIVPACRRCNSRKHTMTGAEFRVHLETKS